ncbi:PLP-dependent cysteine synthase family protein [Halococcoides cellulosivorans]|uniref:Cysteine synthase n=1 Tax=Halococcoides cellulosivorans TaxID=1679096 RepID=A0A2R4X0J8_9EURY|nr:PLP-dependent cysteine synthase family protein [Halococcoides cellulosivorans]AWB27332.1 cysteine synthase [Halococcoides cellulosivorans]
MNDSVLETIGSPLVRIGGPTGATVAAKLEGFNPGGSAKDRPARAMIEAAERDGVLEPGDRIVEPTSGNTGIGIALVGAANGYDVTLVMPAGKSAERRRLMRAYGADLELIEGSISDARERAAELADESGVVTLDQFENAANPGAHEATTARELLDQVDRPIDALVVAVGTGGTLSGLTRGLRAGGQNPLIVAVEPDENALLSGDDPGDDEFQGMGPGFVSPNLDESAIDRIERVAIGPAEDECRRLASEEGILVGQSSGAASLAAKRVARAFVGGELDTDADDPLVVTVFPDNGERYLSTGLFDREE